MSIIHLSENAYPELIEYLRSEGHEVRLVKTDESIGRGVGDHADLRMCRMGAGGSEEVLHKTVGNFGGKYPGNAAYCAVVLDGFLIHRLDITAPEIAEFAEKRGKLAVNVRQGYTRCSCAVIDGQRLITADEGIVKTLENYPEIALLKISGGNVLLPGFDCGFIGGAMGRVGDEILFNGDISKHPDYEIIKKFIEAGGLKIKFFGGELRDIGSIIEEKTCS